MSDWISIVEAAERVGKPPVTVRRWAREGLVEADKRGGVWLVNPIDVVRLAEDGVQTRVATLDGQVDVALRQAWTRVRRDVERDDLPDIIDHRDFDAASSTEIDLLVGQLSNGYTPGRARRVEMPKSLLLSRPLVDLQIEDRVVFEACVQTLAPSIDALLHPHVYSHRLRHKSTGSRLTRYWVEAHRSFTDYVRGEAAVDPGENVCLVSDIASFYEYVDHDLLLDLLSDVAEGAGTIDLLRRLLRSWRSEIQSVGLPQGPTDASGILANLYLHGLDSVLLNGSVAYARYGDDLRVFYADSDTALRAAPRFIGALRDIGLNLATAKTAVKTIQELVDDEKADRRAAVSYGVEARLPDSLDELRAIFDDAVRDPMEVDTTDYTFAVWRLGLLEDPYPLDRILQLLPHVPFGASINADYFYRLGSRPEVLEGVARYLLSDDNVHPWTELHLMRLVGTFDEIPSELLGHIRARARESQEVAGDFSARTLGTVGTATDRRELRRIALDSNRDPARRRAAMLGVGSHQAENRDWADPLVQDDHRQVARAAEYLTAGRHVPRTLVTRRTPPWAPELKEKLALVHSENSDDVATERD